MASPCPPATRRRKRATSGPLSVGEQVTIAALGQRCEVSLEPFTCGPLALAVGPGLPALVFAAVALSTSALSDRAAFIGLVVFGAVYWIVVEQHSAMRFARLRTPEGSEDPPVMTPADMAIFFVYNLIWWVPVLLAVLGILSFWAGSLGFVVVSVLRAVVNAYRNNVLPVEAAQRFPLRSA